MGTKRTTEANQIIDGLLSSLVLSTGEVERVPYKKYRKLSEKDLLIVIISHLKIINRNILALVAMESMRHPDKRVAKMGEFLSSTLPLQFHETVLLKEQESEKAKDE